MECDDAGHLGNPSQQGGDVREADHGLWPACQSAEIHGVDDSSHAKPAAEAPYRIDLGVAQRFVEVGQSIGVRARQIAVPAVCVRAHDRIVIQRTAELLGSGYIIPLQQGSRRCDQCDAASASQPRRTYVRF